MTQEYLRRKAAAAYLSEKFGLRCSEQTLARLAVNGNGPLFQLAGRFPIYRPANLDEYAASRLSKPVRSNAEARAKTAMKTKRIDAHNRA
jgi:hypothetical protein